ncbi:MAG TPA: hypothetical protein VFQ91_04630 [Bryobacteraceae bacterium]|nr:hypothetical protein [Bryobacteraceae bacterium]
MKNGMEWNPTEYGPEAARLLALAGDGLRLMPLVSPRNTDAALAAELNRPAREVFPRAAHPEAALAGLWLYCGYFEESHSIAQDLASAEGSYWHAILHRMEPDASNAGYWFRRVGQHPLFAEVRESAAALGYATGGRWDPYRFIDACERVDGKNQRLLQQVQLAEWQLLFHFCAKAEA